MSVDADRTVTVLNLVRDIVKSYNRYQTGWDTFTQQKLEHNHARFFDLDTVRTRFDREIMGDIREFLSL